MPDVVYFVCGVFCNQVLWIVLWKMIIRRACSSQDLKTSGIISRITKQNIGIYSNSLLSHLLTCFFFSFCRVTLPYSQTGVFIERTPTYIKIKAKLGLHAIWNEEDSFLVGLWLHRNITIIVKKKSCLSFELKHNIGLSCTLNQSYTFLSHICTQLYSRME